MKYICKFCGKEYNENMHIMTIQIKGMVKDININFLGLCKECYVEYLKEHFNMRLMHG